jgi:hypothetical protein
MGGKNMRRNKMLAMSVLIILTMLTITVNAMAYEVIERDNEIIIDGVVTAEEWGDPVEAAWISKGYESESDMFWSWEFVPGYQSDASYEVYYRYDDEYLYFACTAHNIKPGNELTGEQLERHWENEYWKRGGMWLGVSTYEDALATTPEAMKMTKIMFSLLDNGQKYAAHDMVLGHWCTEYETVKYPKLTEDDYAIVWSEPDLTYEVRIPWTMITAGETPKAGDHIVTSVAVKMNMIAGNAASENDGGNVMMWGQGVMGLPGVTLKESGIPLELVSLEEANAGLEPDPEPTAEASEPPAETAETEPEPVEEPGASDQEGEQTNIIPIIIIVVGVILLAVLVVVMIKNRKTAEK